MKNLRITQVHATRKARNFKNSLWLKNNGVESLSSDKQGTNKVNSISLSWESKRKDPGKMDIPLLIVFLLRYLYTNNLTNLQRQFFFIHILKFEIVWWRGRNLKYLLLCLIFFCWKRDLSLGIFFLNNQHFYFYYV